MKWLLVVFQPDGAAKDLACDFSAEAPVPHEETVRVRETDSGWEVDTGPLRAAVSRSPFELLYHVRLGDRTVLSAG